ncbi:MAG: protein-L-isoaspartate(D-aspartate) O-methyltransferase [Desulfatibacillaceae bacterium]
MVERQIKARGITDERVLDAFRNVERHKFVPEALRDQAYRDFPLPIGEGQTISQPYIVAEMTQSLQIGPEDRVLEIGTGSGYQAAILAELAHRVYTIERIRSLYIRVRKLFDELHYHNIVTKCADGTLGWPEEAPFDAIIVTAGAPAIPEALVAQLAEGGRMIIPSGDTDMQTLTRIVRDQDGISETTMGGCRFVKLIGQHGWSE